MLLSGIAGVNRGLGAGTMSVDRFAGIPGGGPSEVVMLIGLFLGDFEAPGR